MNNKNNVHIKKNCFAMRKEKIDGREYFKCDALKKTECEDCKFFMTRVQHLEKLLALEKRKEANE